MVPKVWELIRCFKNECKTQGYTASENEDWVHVGDEYHNFLWTRTIHPSSFTKIAKASKCAVKEGISYQVVDVAYTAWLFSQSPPEELFKTVMDNQNLSKKIAVYDLSGLHLSKPICIKLNLTESKIFKEFEDFLRTKWGVEFKSSKDVVTAEA